MLDSDAVIQFIALIVSVAGAQQYRIDLRRWWICTRAKLLPLKLIYGWLCL